MAEIKSLSITHVSIMDFLMANPTMHLSDVAKHFGYTQPWLSQIIHSDAFQNMLKEKQNIAFHHTVLPLREKITQAAHQALDKVMNLLPQETELRTVKDVAESMLDKIGYGSKGIPAGATINQQNNFIMPNATSEEVAAARALMLSRRPAGLGVQVDGVSVPITLPRESFTSVGEAVGSGNLPAPSGENSSGEGGDRLREESPSEVI